MQIAVIGSGMVGSLIASELGKENHVTVFDNSKDNLNKIESKKSNIEIKILDVNNSLFETEIKNYQLAINCLPGFMGYSILKKMIKLGISCTDISFMPEDCLDLSDLALKHNSIVIPDAGVAPGLSNLIIGNIIVNNDIKEIRTMVGGLPKKKKSPWNYKAPFSPIDVIEEYTRPARMMIDGKLVTKPALSEIDTITFEECGALEAFNTDGLRSILLTMNHIPNMKEKTLRYPGHAELMQSIYDQGLFNEDKINETVKSLFKDWALGKNEKEFTVLDINIYSASKNIHYHLYDEFNEDTQSSSMARTTGYTATATINMIANNLWNKKGVHPPEDIGLKRECINFLFKYLNSKGISIKKI